ncbi:Uncharacterized protein TCM_033765 [Theobroma cacao]|uniref:Uncharacterized protein n=1 Tax=Theobroma cacao TaxID=3641 RepID=A0A061FBT2_THECC|nr:Uncharacterized protein TCM_033765 [Theobroma cacao]
MTMRKLDNPFAQFHGFSFVGWAGDQHNHHHSYHFLSNPPLISVSLLPAGTNPPTPAPPLPPLFFSLLFKSSQELHFSGIEPVKKQVVGVGVKEKQRKKATYQGGNPYTRL